jgi:hypothetical protein
MAEMYVPDHRMRDGNYYLIASGAGATVLVVVLRLASGEVQASLVWCGVVGYPDRCGLGDPPSNL